MSLLPWPQGSRYQINASPPTPKARCAALSMFAGIRSLFGETRLWVSAMTVALDASLAAAPAETATKR